MRRVVLVALGLMLLASPPAAGRYLGSDLVGNVSPESRAGGGLVDRYPLSAYSLDYHVDVGVTDMDDVPATIAHWAAAQLWNATSFLVKTVIDLFTWAFSLDLLSGAHGALAPVADAISSIYENVIGEAWMVAAILVAGLWGIWKALVQRRYTETIGGLAVSVVFVIAALFFVYQPQRTIGEASRWTNTLSLAFLSGANRGSLDDPEQAKRQVADHLFETLVYRPWVVLEFGGLRHCVDTDRLDGDGFPRPVGPHDASRDVCRDHLRPGRDGHGGYAERYLWQPAGSDERKAEYEALKNGALPCRPDAPVRGPRPDTSACEEQFRGYRVDKADAPAVDIQQAGGAFERLTFAVIVLLGALGAVVLLGFLSLAVILAQVVALVLLGFAPVALVIGIFPGAGHDFFRGWLTKLATAIFIKALYSLVIAIVLAVSAALAASTDSLGFLFAFGLQTLFFWAIFLYRKQITARLVAATTGSGYSERLPKMTVVQRGADVAKRPFTALVGVTRPSKDGRAQQSVLAGGPATPLDTGQPSDSQPAANGNRSAHGTDQHVTAAHPQHVNRSPTRNGSQAEPTQPAMPSPAGDGGATDRDHRHPRAAQHVPAGEQTPRASHEDVMRRARELRERDGSSTQVKERDG